MTPNGATVPFRGIHLVRKQLFPYFGSYSPVHNLPTMPAVFTYFINAPRHLCDDCALYSELWAFPLASDAMTIHVYATSMRSGDAEGAMMSKPTERD